MKRRLGILGRPLFASTQLRTVRELSAGDLVAALGITPRQEHEPCSHLARALMIAQVRCGSYLIPPTMPPGSMWTSDHAFLRSTLMADCDGRYQV